MSIRHLASRSPFCHRDTRRTFDLALTGSTPLWRHSSKAVSITE